MKSRLFSVFTVVVVLLSGVVAEAKTLTPEQWNGLVQKTLAEGEASQSAYGTVVNIARQKKISETQTRKIYFSVLGTETKDSFRLKNMSVVVEVWESRDGGSETLQWSYLFTPTGELDDLWNRKIMKTANGGVKLEELPTKDVPQEQIDRQILEALQYFSNEAAD